jgi:hypothetical protein
LIKKEKSKRYISSTISKLLFFMTWLSVGLMDIGCNQCSDTNIEKKGDETIWESIPLGISEDLFLKAAARLMALESSPDPNKVCSPQISMPYPDVGAKEIRERSAGNRLLTNCTVRSHSANQTPTLLEVRGGFIAGKLSRLSYRLVPSQYQATTKILETRFGPGDQMTFAEQMVIDDQATTYRYWTDKKEIWLLTQTDSGNALLVHQDLLSGSVLPMPQPVSRKGKPVSLEDIGIGQLDLKAPLPSLDGINLPDGGVIAPSPSPEKERP